MNPYGWISPAHSSVLAPLCYLLFSANTECIPCWGFISQAQLSETNPAKVLGMGDWVPLLYLLPPVWAGSVYRLCSSNSPSGVLVQGKKLGYRQLEENSTHTKKVFSNLTLFVIKGAANLLWGFYFPIASKPRQERAVLLISFLNSQLLVGGAGKNTWLSF